MKLIKIKTGIRLIMVIMLFLSCVKPFEPPVISALNSYLVVEGVVIPGSDSSKITLSRSRNLTDTTSFIPENTASVRIVSKLGQAYQLTPKGKGLYTGLLNLSPGQQYQLRINTSDGSQYESDFESVVITPPIDSLTWKEENDVSIFVNTRDPQNNTRFYRWEYSETWEYHSYYESIVGFKNGSLYYLDSSEKKFACWDSVYSDKVIIGASEQLTEDIITNLPVTTVPNGSDKMSVRYSILVKQFGLSRGAYNFWQEIKKNGTQVGGLFDPLPSQLIGNIRCLSNPAEPVIGYFSMATIQTKRLYILNSQITNWKNKKYDSFCTPILTSADSASNYLWDPKLAPAYFITGGGLAIANVFCVDCRLQGGINRKPVYWP
ncbi:MAG: DUF4249 domain-containing protein [Chitinophagaceae bacterium]